MRTIHFIHLHQNCRSHRHTNCGRHRVGRTLRVTGIIGYAKSQYPSSYSFQISPFKRMDGHTDMVNFDQEYIYFIRPEMVCCRIHSDESSMRFYSTSNGCKNPLLYE